MHQTRLFQHRLQKERPVCAAPRALSCALSSCAHSSSTSCTAVCTSQPAKPQHKGHRLAAAVLLHSSYAGTHVSARAPQCCQPALTQHNTSHQHYGAPQSFPQTPIKMATHLQRQPCNVPHAHIRMHQLVRHNAANQQPRQAIHNQQHTDGAVLHGLHEGC